MPEQKVSAAQQKEIVRLLESLQVVKIRQIDICNTFGIAKSSVANWVTGVSIPSREHLEGLVDMAIQAQANFFDSRQDLEEQVRRLFQLLQPRKAIDELWLKLRCTTTEPIELERDVLRLIRKHPNLKGFARIQGQVKIYHQNDPVPTLIVDLE